MIASGRSKRRPEGGLSVQILLCQDSADRIDVIGMADKKKPRGGCVACLECMTRFARSDDNVAAPHGMLADS